MATANRSTAILWNALTLSLLLMPMSHTAALSPVYADEAEVSVPTVPIQLPSDSDKQHQDKPARFVFVLDVSGSMSDANKLKGLKEATKLAIALLDGELTIVPFSDRAYPTSSMPLTDSESRRKAMARVDSLHTIGGTNYLAPLKGLKRTGHGTVILFVSDGENNTGSDSQVLSLARKSPGPIYTIGVSTSAKAQNLLTRIAAATGGSAVKIDSAEELTKQILKLAQLFGNYRSFTPQETDLSFPGTLRNVIGIGYEAIPTIDGTPSLPEPPFQHRANLPGEDVLVSRVSLTDKTNIRIQVLHRFSPQGRLACVLRNDQPSAAMTLQAPGGTAPAGGTIVAVTEFFDPDGKKIDPRNRPDLLAAYLLRDENGTELGKFPAQPSTSKPALTATLPLPNKAGPITVVQGSRVITPEGHRFDAFDEQTILLEEALSLTAQPSKLSATPRVGKFTVSTKLTPQQASAKLPDSLAPHLKSPSPNIALLRWNLDNQLLELEFEAANEGEFTGSLTIADPTSNAVLPLSVPYCFHVQPTYLGLKLEKLVDLGVLRSGSGQTVLGPIAVKSRDQHPGTYVVRLTDLSNGSELVPLKGTTTQVTAALGQPAELEMTADIREIPPGIYTGTVSFLLTNVTPPRSWEAQLKLVVTDALSIQPLNFGHVEPGMIRNASLILCNRGPELRGLSLSPETVKAEGGVIQLSIPSSPAVVAQGSETAIPVKLAVSPLVTSRGELGGAVRLTRPSGHTTLIPVHFTLVDVGTAPSSLIVSPTTVSVSGQPGQVLQFTLGCKLAPTASQADQLTITSSPLTDSDRSLASNRPALEWLLGDAVTATKRADVKGYIVAPGTPGTYQSQITIASHHSGRVTVPLTVDVAPVRKEISP